MAELEAKKRQYERIVKRIENEVGHIDGIMFLILMIEGFGKSAMAAIENDTEMNGLPEKIQRACKIIVEELEAVNG